MMFVYPLGIPLAFAVLLYQHRYDLCPRLKERGVSYLFTRTSDWEDDGNERSKESEERVAHLSFLHEMYETPCFW